MDEGLSSGVSTYPYPLPTGRGTDRSLPSRGEVERGVYTPPPDADFSNTAQKGA